MNLKCEYCRSAVRRQRWLVEDKVFCSPRHEREMYNLRYLRDNKVEDYGIQSTSGSWAVSSRNTSS